MVHDPIIEPGTSRIRSTIVIVFNINNIWGFMLNCKTTLAFVIQQFKFDRNQCNSFENISGSFRQVPCHCKVRSSAS
jgi:hypothetical protein